MIKLSQIIILNVPKREREGKYLKKLIETSAKPFGIEVVFLWIEVWGFGTTIHVL